ncbi:hypothetical protein MMYC01_207139 [Madurella mycetomatis]|uniref:Rhodopsin domain-containing protein n=1 Tax=Madurella mycetomatis TaxID=100816 RepID=A0A175VZV2_9PEZI|nr:hypothetical protein MMYC01_207139 [Madurella mycetomatis]
MSSPGAPAPNIDPARAAESNTALLLSVLTVFHVIALTFVALRVYARAFVIRTFGKDDVFMVLSALCAMGGWTVFVFQSFYGLGKHEETISTEDMVTFQHAGFWQSVISATCALCFLKMSIGFNLLRLSTSKWYSWCLWVTIVFVVCYSFMAAMTFFLHCSPMEGHWNPALQPQCYSIQLFVTFALINTSFNITTDVLFASFPIPVIWSLQMKRKLRLYLIGILSLGYFAVAMGIVKAVFQIAFAREPDKTFHQSVQFWGFLQLNIGIIAACATSLRPLVNRILKLSTTDAYNGPSKYGYGSRSRGTRGGRRGTGLGDIPGSRLTRLVDAENAYEMQSKLAGHENGQDLPTGKGETISTAMSFYKHGSAEGSGSEEMILQGPTMPAHAITTDEAGGGIMRTTEVRVTVK